MLVNELRKEIENYDKKELKNIIVELYKRIPKSKKEDYNIDEFIKNGKKVEVKNDKLTIEQLEKEINYFLECVDYGYYSSPNKVISKKDRSTWRFKVKRYYKELINFLPNTNDGIKATKLLSDIFKRVSIGSNTLLFTNWETFRAIDILQGDFYEVIIKRILFNDYSRESMVKCIDLLDLPKDPYDFGEAMFDVFANCIKDEKKEEAIELLNEKIKEIELNIKETKNSHILYYLNEDKNSCVTCILKIYLSINKITEGIKYFHENYVERDKEILEYILLNILEEFNLKEEWIKEFEKYIKLDYRQSLLEKYKLLKDGGEFN